MFIKDSRYRKCTTYVATDTSGRESVVVYPRTIVPAESFFEHTVTENDRLDILSNKYYKKPKKWWQICDANPESMFPGDLLDQSPIHTVIVRLEIIENSNDQDCSFAFWQKEIKKKDGVIDVIPQDNILYESIENTTAESIVRKVCLLEITFNGKILTESELKAFLSLNEKDAVKMQVEKTILRAGEKIVLPPDQIIR
jgi:hypothetical protein